MPSAPEVAREALIVVAGAVIAAAVVGAFPRLKAWLKEQWQ
jgi:Flp pilus assembly pilin Flp